MFNQLLMVFGVLCCLLGAAVLFGTAGTSDASVLAGGAMLSLGIIVTSVSFGTWLRWRKYLTTKATHNDAELMSNHKLPAAIRPLALKSSHDRTPYERRRSQRIMVQVAVLLGIETPNQERPATLGFTTWVNAHGGLLESPVRIRPGQRITLVIPQSRKEAGCRVLRVQRASEESFATVFEFDRQSPEFWPIASPPLDWAVVASLR
jgi:hypothetical protein